MGCSRPGALAVACVVAAGVVSMISLLLPYWYKMELEVATQNQLEVTFGLWGACISLKPIDPTILDSPVVTNGSEVVAIAPESAASETLTCGSYFDAERVRITCTSFRQLAWGQCTRRDLVADSTLCEANAATAFLGVGIQPTTMASWLRFLEMACGKTGLVSIALAVVCSVCTGLTCVLLVFGITCAKIDSCVGMIGAVCAACTAGCQLAVAVLWRTETRIFHVERATFGTSFYLNGVSILLHLIAFLATKKHQRLEKEAIREHLGDDLNEIKQATNTTGDDNKTVGGIDLAAV